MVFPIGVFFDTRNGGQYKPVILKSQVIKNLIQFDGYTYEDANDFWNKKMMMDDATIIAIDDMLSQEEISKLIYEI